MDDVQVNRLRLREIETALNAGVQHDAVNVVVVLRDPGSCQTNADIICSIRLLCSEIGSLLHVGDVKGHGADLVFAMTFD